MNSKNTINLVGTSEDLANTFIQRIQEEIQASESVFYKPLVIITNKNITNWLKLELARQVQIAMGIDFVFMESFLQKFLPSDSAKILTEVDYFYSVLPILRDPNFLSEFPDLQSILEDEDGISQKKSLDLAFQFSSFYIKYQKELGKNWENYIRLDKNWGGAVIRIFREIEDKLTGVGKNRVHYKDFFQYTTAFAEKWQKPIHVLGAGQSLYLPLEALQNLEVPIHFYQLYPYQDQSNSLSWQAPLRDRIQYIKASFSAKPIEIKSKLQIHDNLSFFQGLLKGVDSIKHTSKKGDNSLSILISANREREVEAIHSDIYQKLQSNENLNPSDFLVLVPSLDSYYHPIERAFSRDNRVSKKGNKLYDLKLKYTFTDKRAGKTSRYFLALQDLWKIGTTKEISRRWIAMIIRHKGIQKKLGIDENSIKNIEYWMEELHFYKDVPNDELELNSGREFPRQIFSWKYFLKRLRLGLLIHPDFRPFILESYQNTNLEYLPKFNLSRDSLSILNSLEMLDDWLDRWRTFCSIPHDLKEWSTCFPMIEEILAYDYEDTEDSLVFTSVRTTLRDLPDIEGKFYSEDIQKILESKIEEGFSTQEAILKNGITISALRPVRPVPFAYVYILGLNDTLFKREPIPSPYDLSPEHKEDRSLNHPFRVFTYSENQKIMILEAILSTRSQLILSMLSLDQIENLPLILTEIQTQDKAISERIQILCDPLEGISPNTKDYRDNLLSESGPILNPLIDLMKTHSIQTLLRFNPISRYSRFFFVKKNHLIPKITPKYSKEEEQIIRTLLDNDRNSNDLIYRVNTKDQSIPLTRIIKFLLNPLDDYLERMGFVDYEIDPNSDVDLEKINYTSEDFTAKILKIYEKEGSLNKNSIENIFLELERSGNIPRGNWSPDSNFIKNWTQTYWDSIPIKPTKAKNISLKNGALQWGESIHSTNWDEDLKKLIHKDDLWDIGNGKNSWMSFYPGDLSQYKKYNKFKKYTKILFSKIVSNIMNQTIDSHAYFTLKGDKSLTIESYENQFKDGLDLKFLTKMVHFYQQGPIPLDLSGLKDEAVLLNTLKDPKNDVNWDHFVTTKSNPYDRSGFSEKVQKYKRNRSKQSLGEIPFPSLKIQENRDWILQLLEFRSIFIQEEQSGSD
jgi:hypothetical protein